MQELKAPRTEATFTMVWHQVSHTMASGSSVPHAPSSVFVLLPDGLFVARRTYPFGMDNAVMSLTRTICPGARTCMERPLVLPRNAGTR